MATEVAVKETLIMEPVALNSFDLDEKELTKTIKTQLRQRIPYSADDEVIRSVTADQAQLKHGGVGASQLEVQTETEKASGKSKFWGHGFHYRKMSNGASDDSSGSHGFLPGLIKKAGFGSQEFKEFLCNTAKDFTEVHPHHQQNHHHHDTRDKEIFGFEDASVHAREHDDLFGMRDMEYQENIEKANTLFGFEDTKFERGEKGRDLFGSDDPDTLSFRRGLEILGPLEADADDIEKTRHVFGDENAEDSGIL